MSPDPSGGDTDIPEASGPILIKFYVNHHWAGGLTALGVEADCLKIVVSMATDSSHRLTMGIHKKSSPKPQGKGLSYFVGSNV